MSVNRFGCLITLILIVLSVHWKALHAEEGQKHEVPDRYGLAITLGNTYDPDNDTSFAMLTGFAIYDYDKIWPHAAPENLRFKVEGSIGSTLESDTDFMASAGIAALYYLDSVSLRGFRPYIEGGIGLIYTGFKVPGQGLHLNFNPQAGIGAEFEMGSKSVWSSLRLHHLSNMGIDDENRGVNSVVLLIGTFF